ncbi:MAG TPA: DUF4878 domain-containing protein [Crocinitomix sp.]|nr:DUF4878 domain-containing protein [Crocinitomix sp.]
MKLRTLVLGAVLGLVMTACNGGGADSPEGTTEAFVKALSEGDCDKALTLATGSAEEQVKGTKDAGCEATKEELVGEVTCETEGEKSTCSCTIKNQLLGENKYNYELEKVDGAWKVSSYQKDMSGMMDGLGDMELGGE